MQEKTVADSQNKLIPDAVDKAIGEVVSPSAHALGTTLGTAVKTALRPVDGLVWTVDRAFDWVAQRVTAFLSTRGIDPDALRKPSVEVEASILFALRTAGPSEDPTLRNLFAALLATAMYPGGNTRFHPSFLNVLSLLTPHEARLVAIAASRHGVVVSSRARLSWGQVFRATKRTSSAKRSPTKSKKRWPPPKVPLSTIHKEWRFLPPSLDLDARDPGFSLRNLERLGVIEQHHISGVDFAPEKMHDPAFTQAYGEFISMRDEYHRAAQKYRDENPRIPLDIDESFHTETFDMTIWGADFARACAAPEFYDPNTRQFKLPEWAA